MPYCARGGALRRPWGRWGCLTYGARGGRLTLTAPVGAPYGVRGGALRRPRGCLTLTAPVGAPQVEEYRILFLFSGYSLSLSILKCLGVLVRYSFVIEVSNNIEQALSSNINKQLALPHNLRIVHIVRRQVYKVRSQRCSTAPACRAAAAIYLHHSHSDLPSSTLMVTIVHKANILTILPRCCRNMSSPFAQ